MMKNIKSKIAMLAAFATMGLTFSASIMIIYTSQSHGAFA